MKATYFVVDAFTNRPFTGNSAAVVSLAEWSNDSWLQSVAMEMNLAATAFLVANDSGYDLRWFTPKAEISLCGHATLAASIVLGRRGELFDGETVQFSTRSGLLAATRKGARIELNFPAISTQSCAPPGGLIESLKISPRFIGRGGTDYLVEVESASEVRRIAPDFAKLATIECRGVIVTAGSDDPQFDFISRFFAPSFGINEDSVTGSAHCQLGPFWTERLGKSKLTAFQASPRGGVVCVEVVSERVTLGGGGIVIASGELEVLN